MAFQIHCERPSTGQIWEMVTIGGVKISKTKNQPSSLSCTFLRDYMTVENGDVIAVQTDESGGDDLNLFYGFVYRTSKSLDEVTVTAYDQLYAMKLSSEIKVYGTITASDLYRQISDEHKYFMLEPPNVTDSGYPIPDVIADNSNLLDLMTEALNATHEATGKQYYIFDFFKNLCMEECEEYRIPKENFEFNADNIKAYDYDEDASKLYNEVVVKSNDDQNTTLAVRRDEESIDAYGAITFTERVKDGQNAEEYAQQLFEQKRVIVPEMSITAYGLNAQVVPGRLVHVDLFTARKEYIYGWFIVESCEFSLENGSGDMDVKLKLYEMESGEFGN